MISYTDEMIDEQAEWSKEFAEKCCKCRYCGAHVPYETGRRYVPASEPSQPSNCCDSCWSSKYQEEARRELKKWRDDRALEEDTYNAALRKSADPDAARHLESLISEISEETYCAGWLSDIEHTLWSKLDSGGFDFGMGHVQDGELAELKRLHEKCGGWWTYRKFVTTAEWKEIHAKWQKQLDAFSARAG